ncbi:hypothetical protein [Streptosporangium amethystogenes]|uniref:hypothetical protein n=1 Tax=Streptosporangium amethystogenes TaxID=2002 RepID=UPI0012FC25D2|nr:hypothetical protein [Streptosporangium amethystogenes]
MSIDQEQITYPDEHRRRDLDLLREIMGGEPDPEMLKLDRQRDREFAVRRSHAA